MLEASLVLYGGSVLAPVLLFGVLIWSGIERLAALAALERRVRERILRPRPVAPELWFAALTPRRRRDAA